MSERRHPSTLTEPNPGPSPDLAVEQTANRPETNWPPAEVFKDSLRIERRVFRVSETTSVIFRGQEELPDFAPADQIYGQPQLLAPEAQPTYASPEDYQNWYQKQQAETGPAGYDCLIAPATPLGVLDVAIKLTEKGLAPGQIGQLDQLRAKLRDGVFDAEVGRLYDVLFAAATVGHDGPGREQALIETALCLADDPAAIEIVSAKLLERQAQDQQNWDKLYGGQPGRRLSPEQLEALRQKRLVAVHTTRGRPEGRILPSAAYNQDSKDHFPRTTVHTSLNHPVESHMMGGFKNNNYTVVSPLAEMVDLNGVPDVLNSVDTYFTANPAEGLKLPEATILVELGVDQPGLITVDGRHLRVRQGPVLAGDIAELAAFGARLNPDRSLAHGEPNRVFANLVKSVDKLLAGDLRCLKTGEEPLIEETRQTVAELARLQRAAIESDDPRYQPNPAGERDLARQLLTYYTELGPQDAAAYPAMTKALQESVRQFLVRESISHLGGLNIEAGAHYSFDQDFNQAVSETAQGLGLRRSLHQNQPESFFEHRAYGYKRDVFDPPKPALGAELSDRDLYRQQQTQAHDRQNLGELWDELEHLRPEWRQAALSGDFLTYTPPPAVDPKLAAAQPLLIG